MKVATLLRIECMKFKGTSILAIPILAALLTVMVIVLMIATQSADKEVMWSSYYRGILQIWFMLVLPLYIGVQTAQYAALEHEANAWKLLFVAPIAKSTLVYAKLVVSLLLVAFSFIALGIGIYIGAVILQALNADESILSDAIKDLGSIVFILASGFGATIGVVVIQCALSILSRSMALPIMTAVGGLIAISMAGGRELLQHLLPWSWPYNAYLQNTNNSDALVSLAYAVISSIVLGVAVSLLLVVIVVRRDER